MNITVTNRDNDLLISLDGRLDTVTAPDLEAVLSENAAKAAALVLDCEKLEYVSSAGLRVLLAAQKKMDGAMKLTNVCELVMEVFEMTGFADILVIE